MELSGVCAYHPWDTSLLEFRVNRDSAMGSWRGICLVDLIWWAGRSGFFGFRYCRYCFDLCMSMYSIDACGEFLIE